MATTVQNADLSVLNPELSKLTARAYKGSYTEVLNSRLTQPMFNVLNRIYLALTGIELPLDGATIGVSSREGLFYRMYPPRLYKSDAGLFIKWGSEHIALSLDSGALALANDPGTASSVSFKFCTVNPSGRGEDPGLSIKAIYKDGKDSTVVTTTISVAVENWKEYDAELFNTLLESGSTDELLALISSEGGRGSREGSDLPVIDRKTILTKLFGSVEEQTFKLELDVVGYRPVNASYGQTYILTCNATDNAEVAERVPEMAGQFGIWAEKQTKWALAGSPTITSDKPAKLTFPVGGSSVLVLSDEDEDDSL